MQKTFESATKDQQKGTHHGARTHIALKNHANLQRSGKNFLR
jgi:hypothetical protein